ncbi:hypothetical protein EC988_005027 [Linderina pennispora]|nr:hypothetical protein EC988_005027 [Linderina pennispora]
MGLTAIRIYMLGGFLYNRVFNSSRGLRGLEQLPNYAVWHAIYVFFSTCFLTVFDVVTCRRGAVRRRGDISLDSEEYNIRTQLFDSDSDSDDAQPLSRRS